MAASSEELSGQSVLLTETISFFKLSEKEHSQLKEEDILMQIEKLTQLLHNKSEKNIKQFPSKDSKENTKSHSDKKSEINIKMTDDDFDQY